MRNALRAPVAVLALIGGLSPLIAQPFPTIPYHTVIGRIGAQPGDTGPGQAIPFANLGALLLGGPQSPNIVYAGPASGPSANPGFRALVGADLPNPGASSKGGIQSLTCATHQWLNAISIAGVPACAQPNFTDLAGSIAGAQIPAGTVTSAMILDGTIVDADVSASAAIAGSKVTLATTGAPGTVPTLPNDGTKFYNGLGAYAAPTSAGQMILLNTLTASNSATLSDTTTLTSAYSIYEIVLENILPATNATTCEIQVHASAAFQTSGYTPTFFGNANGADVGFGASASFMNCSFAADASSTAARGGISGSFRITTPSNAAIMHPLIGQFGYLNSSGNGAFVNATGVWPTAAAVDGFQVLFSAGNIISGQIKIYGIQ